MFTYHHICKMIFEFFCSFLLLGTFTLQVLVRFGLLLNFSKCLIFLSNVQGAKQKAILQCFPSPLVSTRLDDKNIFFPKKIMSYDIPVSFFCSSSYYEYFWLYFDSLCFSFPSERVEETINWKGVLQSHES